MDGNGKLTVSEGKRTKGVMVRLPKLTVERIDDFAGDTHSSRPDFIEDAVRQYIQHVISESSRVISSLEGLEVSKQAKEVYFIQEMGRVLYHEMDGYRNSKGNRMQEISVLVSMPVGLQRMITDTVEFTGLFGGNQEFIKTAIHFMFDRMGSIKADLEAVAEFQSMPNGSRALEEELEQIRRELQGDSDRED